MAHTIPPFIHHSPPFLCFSHHQPPPLPSSPPTITITHTHHKATVVIHCPLFCLTHTHGVGGMWLCGCSLVLCVSEWWLCGLDGMHIPPLRPHTHTGTRTVALPIATPPLHRVCPCNHVPCVLGQPHHTVPCPGLLAFFASVCHPRLSHPPCVRVCVCGGLVVGVCWCGHLCEWLSGGWLCWLHHTVCRVCLHTLTRLCLHSLTGGGWVVDGGPGGGLAGRTVGGVDTCGQGGWHSGTVSLTPLCLSTPCGPSPNSSFLSLLCVWWLSGCVWTWPLAWVARGLGAQAMVA